jgi:hypothetical protein
MLAIPGEVRNAPEVPGPALSDLQANTTCAPAAINKKPPDH